MHSSRFSKTAGKVITSLGRPATTTPSSLHSTRFPMAGKSLRWKTDSTKKPVDLAKSKSMHTEMETVMGEKSMKSATTNANATGSSSTSASASQPIPKVSEQARARQRTQAYINAGISFFTVLLAAQVLKVGMQKRKLTLQVEVLEEILADKRALLRSLGTDETLTPVADQCAKEILDSTNNTYKSPKTSWWVRSTASSSSNQDGDEKEIAERILVTLRAEMQRRIGYEGMTEEEKEKSAVKELQPEVADDFFSDERLLQELQKLEGEKEPNGETVVKKKIFSI
jgi:hypothetical protein